ncbi:MAG: glycosyltransferase, partial [Halobacteriaceae archaeon]
IAELDSVEELIIVGDGEKRSKINHNSNVRFEGWLNQDEAFEIAKSGQVAIAPYIYNKSIQMSSPVKIYSYASMGLPMVLSKGPDIVDELSQRNAAAVTSPGEEFIRKVERLLNTKELRIQLSANAIQASEGYSWKSRSESLYEQFFQ